VNELKGYYKDMPRFMKARMVAGKSKIDYGNSLQPFEAVYERFREYRNQPKKHYKIETEILKAKLLPELEKKLNRYESQLEHLLSQDDDQPAIDKKKVIEWTKEIKTDIEGSSGSSRSSWLRTALYATGATAVAATAGYLANKYFDLGLADKAKAAVGVKQAEPEPKTMMARVKDSWKGITGTLVAAAAAATGYRYLKKNAGSPGTDPDASLRTRVISKVTNLFNSSSKQPSASERGGSEKTVEVPFYKQTPVIIGSIVALVCLLAVLAYFCRSDSEDAGDALAAGAPIEEDP